MKINKGFCFYSVFLTFIFSSSNFAFDNRNEVNLIKNSDFSELDSQGNPVGWTCSCQAEKTHCDLKKDTESGGYILSLKPGCNLSTEKIILSDQSKGIHFSLITKNEPAHLEDIGLKSFSNKVASGYIPTTMSHPAEIKAIPFGFQLNSIHPLSSDQINSIAVEIYNNHINEIQLKSLSATQYGLNPPPKIASLVEATHETVMKILLNSNVKTIWMPLPIDYANQVPLWINLNIQPSNVVNKIHYEMDEVGNWGVIIELRNKISPDTIIHLYWDSIVLIETDNENRLPHTLNNQDDPTKWLIPTAIVQADFPAIREMTTQITSSIQDPIKKIAAISYFEATHLAPPLDNQSQDAVTVFKQKTANCTGFANLMNAMSRSIDLPARSLANIMVIGSTLSTHYINEIYLGANLGWRRIEPQTGTAMTLPADSFLILHKNTPENESEKALHHTPWSAPGVPFMSLVENINDPTANVIFLPAAETFPDCPYEGCNNRAEHRVDLHGSFEEMNKLFELARNYWQYDLHDYISKGEIDLSRKRIREMSSTIQTTEDLKTMLDLLKKN